MIKHLYAIYYRKDKNELWKIIYDDDFSNPNYLQLRQRVIDSLNSLEYQYQIVDKFVGIKKNVDMITDKNEESLFDNVPFGDISEKNVNIAINYLKSLKYFITGDNYFTLDKLVFTKGNMDLILLIRTYSTYIQETIFTKKELLFFKNVICKDFRLILAYFFFEFIGERINQEKFSRYAPTEVKLFLNEFLKNLSIENQGFIYKHITLSAMTLYESNLISYKSKLNLLLYRSLEHNLAFITTMEIIDLQSLLNNPRNNNLIGGYSFNLEELSAVSFMKEQLLLIKLITDKNIMPYWLEDLTKQFVSTKQTNVLNAVIDFEDLMKIKDKKRFVKLVISIITSVIVSVFLIRFTLNIIDSFYTILTIDNTNYQAFVSFNPSITETKYYPELSVAPSKFIYEINLNRENLSDFIIDPTLNISYTSEIGDSRRPLTGLKFESASRISGVQISVSSSYSEKIRMLKTEAQELNLNTTPLSAYILNVISNNFSLEVLSLTNSNYNNYISIYVDAPTDTSRNGVYQYTRYEISINKRNNVELINQVNVAVKYTLSHSYSFSTSYVNVVNFTLLDQSDTDSFGSYRYYDSQINNVSGKITLRSNSR